MKLYVVRHGQIDANPNHLIISTTDEELNEVGIEQAKKLSEKFKEINYDFIISSPLKRTRKTAEIINVKHKQIQQEERLIERNCGILEHRNTDTFDFKPYCNYFQNVECEGGERIVECFDRVWELLNELEEHYPDKTIVLVTHHGICRAIACYYQGMPPDGDTTYYHQSNCEMVEYTI